MEQEATMPLSAASSRLAKVQSLTQKADEMLKSYKQQTLNTFSRTASRKCALRPFTKMDVLTWQSLSVYGTAFANDWADAIFGNGTAIKFANTNIDEHEISVIEKVVADLRALKIYTVQMFVNTKDPRTIQAIVKLSNQLAEAEFRLHQYEDNKKPIIVNTGSENNT